MAPTLVQSKSGTATSGTSLTITLTNPTTSLNTLVVNFGSTAGSTNPNLTGITLGGSPDNFARARQNQAAAVANADVWVDRSCAGGQTSVVLTFTAGSGTGIGIACWVEEWAGLDPSSPVDVVNGGTGASGTWTSGSSGTLSQPSEVITGCVMGFTSGGALSTPGAPWTELGTLTAGTGNNFGSGYQIVSATTAQTYNSTLSGSSQAWAAVIVSLKAAAPAPPSAPSTVPVTQATSPYPLYITTDLRPQNPASKPNTFVQGITASETVSATIGTAFINKTGLVSSVTANSKSGNFYIQIAYTIPAPFPGTSPYPFNIIPKPFVIQPQSVASTSTPSTIVACPTANVNVSSAVGSFSVTNPSVYNWAFPFANNVPYPLSRIARNIKPNVQGQPQVAVKQPAIANSVASAVFGSVTISTNITANESVAAKFGFIFIRSITQQPFPFTNYPFPLKLRNIRPQYSSGKIQFPTVVFGLTANVSAATYLGTVEIGQHVAGYVSNVFAATVPGNELVTNLQSPAANLVSPHLGTIKSNFTGSGTSVSAQAHAGIPKVIIKGNPVPVNANPEFGIVRSGTTVHGLVSTVTTAGLIGHTTVSLNKVAGVTVATSENIKVSLPGHASNVSSASRFGTIKISQANTAHVSVGSSVHVKVSPSISPARVSVISTAKTKISVSESPANVTSSSIPGTRTAIGEVSRIIVSAPVGITKVIIPAHVSSVTAKAQNQGKSIQGITATSSVSSHLGSFIAAYQMTANVVAQSYLGVSGETKIIVNLARPQGTISKLIRPTVVL